MATMLPYKNKNKEVADWSIKKSQWVDAEMEKHDKDSTGNA